MAGPRIVSLVPSLTETLFDLGLGDHLVGRTAFCVEPAHRVGNIAVVGGTKSVKYDRLAELRTTHALVNVDETPKAVAEAITGMGIELVVTHPCTVRDNIALFRQLGERFDRLREAGALVAELEQALVDLPPDPVRRTALYLIWRDPWMTISRDTYVADMLRLAGVETLGHDPDRRYPKIEINQDLLVATDLVLFPDEPFAFGDADLAGFRETYGIEGQPDLRRVDGKLLSWYGSRAIAGVRYAAGL